MWPTRRFLKTVHRCRLICFLLISFFAYYNNLYNGRLLVTRVPKLQALVYNILSSRKMPESDARSVQVQRLTLYSYCEGASFHLLHLHFVSLLKSIPCFHSAEILHPERPLASKATPQLKTGFIVSEVLSISCKLLIRKHFICIWILLPMHAI